MTFADLVSTSRVRFLEVAGYLRYIATLEPEPGSGREVPPEVKVMKGLFYVHLYSALEKTVNQVAETTLNYISARTIEVRSIRPSVLAVILQDNIKSVRGCSSSRVIEKSIHLFENAKSHDIAVASETSLAFWLQNIWAASINELLITFGIDSYKVTGRNKVFVDEVTNKRNAVAHGRDSAFSVGERFRANELELRFNAIQTVAFEVIDSFQSYCEGDHFVESLPS